MSKRNFAVLGGGTAGWITAHSVRKMFPDDNVTIIYSEEKGIVGVGEATTPHIVDFLRSIDVDIFDFLKETGGSIKHAINFENWNGDGKQYYHPFVENIAEFSIPGIFDFGCWDHYNRALISKTLPVEDYLYQARLAQENKIDLQNTNYALHFNTYKFGQYLEKIGLERNITVIKDDFHTANLDENENIKELVLNNSTVKCDFVFDCSGFHKALIGNVYKQSWVSYKKHLPMKKAIAFWLKSETACAPYTSAIAMKYGWMWKIPLQDRIGCGYVYDSDYINEEQAKAEAEEFYGQPLEIRKTLDLNAGRFENVWVKNCIAVGLSGNFIEPLESTSIWLQLNVMSNLKDFLGEIDSLDEKNIELFNKITANDVDEKMNFVYLHYLGKRDDSPFWREFKEKNPMPEKLASIMPLIKEGNIKYHHLNVYNCRSTFPLMSYLWICGGLELFEKSLSINGYERLDPSPEMYKEIINQHMQVSAFDQRTVLSSL